MLSNKKNQRIFYYSGLLILFIFSLYKITLGVHGDELHTVALGDMIVSGNSFFKETWFYLQMSAVVNAPFIWIYKMMTGSADGIVLILRVISDLFQLLITLFFYKTFRDYFEEKYVMCASTIIFMYSPDFRNMVYKVELIWFSILIICFLFHFLKTGKSVYLIATGVCISLSVLCYPPSAILLFFVCGDLYLLHKRKCCSMNALKSMGIIILTCAICGMLFLIYVFATIGINNFIKFFPIVFADENVTGNLYTKLLHPVLKVLAFSVFAIVPVLLVSKIKFLKLLVNKLRLPIVSILFLFAFLGQTFIERRCISWHIITYPYALALAFCILLFWNNHTENTDSVFYIFEVMCIGVVISMIIASNQGNISCVMGMLIAMVLMLIWPESTNVGPFSNLILKEKKCYALTILVISLFTFIYPVYEWETTNFNSLDELKQCSVFTDRELAGYGPLKGIKLGKRFTPQYKKMYDVMIENVNDGEKLCILADGLGAASAGYLCKNINYSTYSPQGGSEIGISDKLVNYYELNPNMIPDVVIVNIDYIKIPIDEFLTNYSFGSFLCDNGYERVNYNSDYCIF